MIDQCTSNPCSSNGACVNSANGYYCQCSFGYTGSKCETQINNCVNNPCLNNGNCMNQIGGYVSFLYFS